MQALPAWQVEPAQHGWPASPQETQLPPAQPRPSPQLEPAQQGWPAPPQPTQLLLRHTERGAVHAPSQQAIPAAPHVPQTPLLLHTPPFGHVPPAATQLSFTQQPWSHEFRRQQIWPPAPQDETQLPFEHELPAGHCRAEPAHTPDVHASLLVQASPSSQAAPSGFAGFEHAPESGLQVPGSWHGSDAAHATGSPPTQVPPTQVSTCVHASPSSQGKPPSFSSWTQAPVAGSQCATWHASRSVQVTP